MRRLLAVLAVLALVLPGAVAWAARVTPMVVTLDEAGTGTVGRVEITNSDDRQLPLEVRMFAGEIGERGELELTPADDLFLVFPPQTVVEPQRQQVFRVQYLGGEPLGRSEIYYMSIREIPVAFEPGSSRIQIVVNFNVLVNVVPEGATSSPAIDTIVPAEREGQPGIEVRVVNTGSRFFAAGRENWTIAGRGLDGAPYTRELPAAEASAVVGYGIVPPGGARIFFVPTEFPLAPDTVRINLGN